MLLSLTSIDTKGEFREFACWLASLELSLDMLSEISASGSQLLTVELNDEGSRMALPVEAFDGQNFSNPIQILQADWQQILSKPVKPRSLQTHRLSALIRQQIENQQTSIAQFKVVLSHIEQRLIQIQRTSLSEPNRSQRLIQGELRFTQCLQHLTRLQTLHQGSKDQLAHLLARQSSRIK